MVFRCDLLPWAGVVGLHLLATRQVSLVAGVGAGAAAVAASLALTVPLDSLLWGRWLWPEGEVLWFNTAQNRCAAGWGCAVARDTPGHPTALHVAAVSSSNGKTLCAAP